MKKIGMILVLLLFLVFTLNIIKADLVNVNPETGEGSVLGLNPDSVPETPEELGEQSKTYLKREWNKILTNSTFFGPIIAFHNNNANWIDPLFQYTIGMPPSLSWTFILALVLWITIAISIFRLLAFIDIASYWLKVGIAIVGVWALSLIGLTRFLAIYLINVIATIDTWWGQLIVIAIVILTLIIYDTLSSELEKVFRALKEKIDKARTERNVKKAKKIAKEAKEIASSKSGSRNYNAEKNIQEIEKAESYAKAFNEGMEESEE